MSSITGKIAASLLTERPAPGTPLPEPPPPDPYETGPPQPQRTGAPPDGKTPNGLGYTSEPALEFVPLAELRARVKARGPRPYLLRGVWPIGAYGVHAAETKAQKSWNALDLAVSVASGTPWLGHVPVDAPGPVVTFWGEGDDASLVRRTDAICQARHVDPDQLPLIVCCRAPHLNDQRHRAEFYAKVAEVQPRLVVLDPFYLSARGANGADLYAMGELLEHPQRVCVALGAALVIVTHYNRRDGRGPLRITGAGPAEWGRVLIGATVKSRRTDPASKATTVVTQLDVIGGEVPERTLCVVRHIVADDPDDLDSPLRYTVTVTDATDTPAAKDRHDLSPAAHKILDAVRSDAEPASSKTLVDRIAAKHGHGLARETVSKELKALMDGGLVDCIAQGEFKPKLWFACGSQEPPDAPL